jgi:Asp/Glu/hydantoin racemase
VPAEEVRNKMKEATKRLLRLGNVTVVCLGCAGMAGMNEMVREAAVEELGQEKGAKVRIVDGVQAGIGSLEALLRMGF